MQMNADELAAKVAEKLQPQVPLTVALWDAKHCAAFLQRTKQYFQESIAPMPGFPKPIRIPTKSGTGHPLWKASEIVKWAQKYQDQ